MIFFLSFLKSENVNFIISKDLEIENKSKICLTNLASVQSYAPMHKVCACLLSMPSLTLSFAYKSFTNMLTNNTAWFRYLDGLVRPRVDHDFLMLGIYGKLAPGAETHYEFCCSFPQKAHSLHALESSIFIGFPCCLLHLSDLDLVTTLS